MDTCVSRFSKTCASLLLLVTGLTCRQVSAQEMTLYVSPAGNDAWSGRLSEPNGEGTDGPVATIQKARDLARAAKEADGGLKAPVKILLPLILFIFPTIFIMIFGPIALSLLRR